MIGLSGIFLLAIAGWFGAADQTALAGSTPGTGIVTLGEIPAVTVRPGDSTAVVIPITIAEGYHVQANPASDEFLIPLELELLLEPPDSLVSWTPVYPAPGTFRLEGTTEDLLTYHGSVEVKVWVYVAAHARKGERLFSGAVSYQGCDTQRCFFPTSVPVAFQVVISEEKKGN